MGMDGAPESQQPGTAKVEKPTSDKDDKPQTEGDISDTAKRPTPTSPPPRAQSSEPAPAPAPAPAAPPQTAGSVKESAGSLASTPPPAGGPAAVAADTSEGDQAAGAGDELATADDVAEDVAASGDKPPEGEDIAVCITVHPPPKSGAAPLVLEPLAGVELVMQVRQLLGEVPQTCLYSAFRLVAVKPKQQEEGDGGRGEEHVWKGEGEVMNDYMELRSVGAVAACPGKVQVRMELEAYTTHTARQHVQKFRELLRYPPPCPGGIGPGAKTGNGKKGKGKGGGGKNKRAKEAAAAAAAEPGSAASPSGQTSTAEITAGGTAATPASGPAAGSTDLVADDMAQRVQRALEIRGRLKDCRVPVGGDGLGSFYGVGLGLAVEEVAHPSKEEAAASARGGDRDKDAVISCLRGLSVSAWNPPPPQRRMVGDLMYLEVTALDGNVIHITCTQGGFYVNGTRRENFDPKPAANNPCHSHELVTCLLAANPSFAKAWNNASAQAWKRSQADDPVHALARAMWEGRGDAVMVKPQWNVPLPDPRWAAHKADPSRAQEDLSNGFGMEDRGVPREWNDEYQCLLELPSDTPDLSMTRSRALHKLLCDFQEAATAGVLAISDSHIPPANPTEAEHSHVFVFNNIFFSYAADSSDAYKAVAGEAAARKSASQDLASVVALNSLSEALHPQLSIKTLATAVVDYSGRRLIAQSLVPGILNGDQTDKVVYGAMEHGQRLRENPKISALLREVGERLMIAEREVDAVPIKKRSGKCRSADGQAAATDSAATANTAESRQEDAEEEGAEKEEIAVPGVTETDADEKGTVRITGAVEMKGIVGSDGRSYLLDVSRLCPRDANWVRGEKGTGVYDDWFKENGDKPLASGAWQTAEGGAEMDMSFEDMAVLRPSLLNMFTRHKMGEWFRDRDTQAPTESPADPPQLEESTAKEDDQKADSPAVQEQTSESPTEDVQTDASKEQTVEKASDPGGAPPIAGEDGEGAKPDESPVLQDEEGGGEAAKPLSTKLSDEEVAKLKEEQEAKCKELEMNVNVFMPYKGCVDDDQLKADENLARAAAKYLWDVALPFVTLEVKRGAICPLDCAELVQALHGAGVNLRYMGRLATVAVEEEAEDAAVRAEGKLRRLRMPLFWLEMLETEMVARAATHVFTSYMAAGSARSRAAPGYAVQQFLNCLLGGSGKSGAKGASVGNGPASSSSTRASPAAAVAAAAPEVPPDSSWMPEDGEVVALTPEGLWQSVSAEVAARFRHRLTIWGHNAREEGPNKDRAHKLPLLRRLCQRLGLRVLSRSYELNKPRPFALEDIVSVYPVVKSCVPASPAPDAAEALDMAQLHLSSGAGLQAAHDLAQHAAAMLLQACDGMHSKYPAALNLQARVMYHVGDADSAVALQLKALAYLEQLEGLDSSAVIKCHEQLGQYYMLAGLYDKALAHMRAFCYLLELTVGPNHPDLANGYHRMGRAYQDVGSGMMALRCYQEALERQAGDHMINPRVHHSVSETLEAMRGYTDALKHERLSHAGYKAVHGDQHPMVVKSTENIRALTTKIVKAAQGQTKAASNAAQGKATASIAAGSSQKGGSTANGSGASGSEPSKASPSVERRKNEVSGTGGVEETKVNGPRTSPSSATGGEGGGAANGGSKTASKKKGRR